MQLERLTDAQLAALYRIAKTRLRPFFSDPRAMIQLRTAYEARFKC